MGEVVYLESRRKKLTPPISLVVCETDISFEQQKNLAEIRRRQKESEQLLTACERELRLTEKTLLIRSRIMEGCK